MAAAGDLDGDGWFEVLAGAWRAAPGSMAEAGEAVLFRGADAAILRSFPGPAPSARLGYSVAAGPDFDGDGWHEALLGAPDAPGLLFAEAGIVELRSLATGGLLATLDGRELNEDFGWSVAFAGDVDGNDTEDLLTDAPLADAGGIGNAGAVRLWSGRTFALLREFEGGSFMDQLGFAVAGPGDLNGDGWPDLAAGAPGNPTGIPTANADGALRLYGFHPIVHPSAASISASAGGRVDLVLHFPDEAAGDLYLLLASATGTGPPVMVGGLEVPLADDPVLRATLAGRTPPGAVPPGPGPGR